MTRLTLGELIELQRGYDLPEPDRRPGVVPVIGSAGVTGYHDAARVKGPGVTLGRSGASFGKVTYVREDYWPHNAALFVKDFKGNDPLFIRYLLEATDFSSLNSGSAQQSLNRNYVYGVPTRALPHAEQRRIASILSAYDDLIENCQRRIRILEDMARGLYREWFVHFRFPGAGALPRVDSPLGPIPQGWAVTRIGALAEEMRRNVVKGELIDSTPYVGLEHIPRRSLALDTWDEVTTLGSNKLAFERNEVLFGKIRPYFHKVSVAPFAGVCSADTIVMRPRSPDAFGLVVAVVSSDEFVAQATATSNGSKMPRASWSVLREWDVAVPDRALLARFDGFVRSVVSQQQVLVAKMRNLRRTRDLLLPRLLSGQIDLASAEPSFSAELPA